MKFFGFAISDSMFSGDVIVEREEISPDDMRDAVEAGMSPCLNPSHKATIEAMGEKHGIVVDIPATPPRVALSKGDILYILSVRGLPRLTDRHEYAPNEIAKAVFGFSKWTVIG